MKELTGEEKEMLSSYLWQDSGSGDLTSILFSEDTASAVLMAEDECIISGMECVRFLFEEEGCHVELLQGAFNESVCEAGSEIMMVSGPVSGILRAERTALNVISRMSGIATMARKASEMAESSSPGTRVAGTRKTTPGFHLFEKRALIDGGALPHRRDLSSLAMIKDNHLAALGGGPDAVLAGVEIIREVHGPYSLIEVEAEDLPTALAAVEAGADIIMLDNMSPEMVAATSEKVRQAARDQDREITLEASGGIGIDEIGLFAPHVDVISMGSLTYGAIPKGFKLEYHGQIETVAE
jgi:nicotinate-nucleotide pyrophosphorylase (carboxylating)